MTFLVFAPTHDLPVAAIGLPLLVWAALRLDPRTVAVEILATSVIAVMLTAAGRGPYGELGRDELTVQLSATLVLGYILTSALIALPLTLAITQRGRDLDVLSESEALFRRNFTESLTGMLLLSRRGDRLEVVDANDTAHALLDNGSRSVVGRYLDRVLTQPTAVRGVTQTMLRGNLDGWRGQLGIIHRPESQVDVAISQLTTGGVDDEDAMFAAQLLDVTPLHQSLARTQAAEQLTNALLDTARCIMMMTDMDGTVVRVNQATTLLTGFAEAELLGQPLWARIIPPAQVDDTREMFDGPDGKLLPGSRESDLRTATGDPLRVLWNTDLVRDEEDGTPQYAVLTGVDVTAERAGAGLMANLFQAGISTAIIGIDAQGSIRVLNSGAETLLGYGSEELQGRQFVDVLDPEELRDRTDESAGAGWRALTSTLEGGNESVVRDWTWRTAQGRRRTVEMTICGGGSQFGPQAGFVVVGRDVTEQRQGQLMLMAALGEGAGRSRPAPPARLRQERVRLHGQPRAADAGHQHRRLHRDARRRRPGAGPPAAAAAAGDDRAQRRPPDLALQRPPGPGRDRQRRHRLGPLGGRPARAGAPDRGVDAADGPQPRPRRGLRPARRPGAGARRRGAARAGDAEPAEQRREVHARPGQGLHPALARGRRGLADGRRQWHRDPPARSRRRCSRSSSAPRPRRRWRSRAPGWACPSWPGSWPPTAAGSGSTRGSVRDPRSRYGSRSTWRDRSTTPALGQDGGMGLEVRTGSGTGFELLLAAAAVADADWRRVFTHGRAAYAATRAADPELPRAAARFGRFGWINLVGPLAAAKPPWTRHRLVRLVSSTSPDDLKHVLVGGRRHQVRSRLDDDTVRAAVAGERAALRQFRAALGETLLNVSPWLLRTDPAVVKDECLRLLEQLPPLDTRAPSTTAIDEALSELGGTRLLERVAPGIHYGPDVLGRVTLVTSLRTAPILVSVDETDQTVILHPPLTRDGTTDAAAQLRELGRALGDDTRIRILQELRAADLTLPDLCSALGSPRTTLLHHLALLRSAGLIDLSVRAGEPNVYALDRRGFETLAGAAQGFTTR